MDVFLVAFRTKAIHKGDGILRIPCNTGHLFHTTYFQLLRNVICSVGELCEHKQLVSFVTFIYQVFQRVKFMVIFRFPCAAQGKHLKQDASILL